MRRLKLVGLALMVTFVVSVIAATAASALELPDIHILPKETFPLVGEGSTKAKEEKSISLQTENSKLPAEEVKILVKVTELSPLGEIDLHFVNVHESKKPENKCNTEGDAEGVVLVKGEFHLVFTSFEPNPLEIAALVLFPSPLTVKCNKGKLNVKVKPPALARVKAEKGKDIESFVATAHCKKAGEQELSSYFNDAGTLLTKQLLGAEFGAGANENGCEEIEEPVTVKIAAASLAKMFEILY
jgi:hypothetical protein